jgi:hypothetical protein
MWTQVGSSYLATTFGIDVANDAQTVDTRLAIRNGNVGIGTLTPAAKLQVNGDIRASLANVSQANLVAYNTSTGLFTYLSTSSFATTNIYNADGTLTGNRTVSLDTNNLTFDAEAADFIIQSDAAQDVIISNLTQDVAASSIIFYDKNTGKLTFEATSSISSLPAGSTTQIQYNNAGAFGADAGFVYSGSRVGIGTTTPGSILEVYQAASAVGVGNIVLNTPSTTGASRIGFKEAGSMVGQIAYSHDNNNLELLAYESGAGIVFYTTGTTERMRIVGSTGNVGIGTINPGALLQVGYQNPTTDALIRLGVSYAGDRTSRGGITWHDSAQTTGKIYTEYDGTMVSMVFGSLYNSGYNSNNLMIIRGNGNVGIGTITPVTKLDVRGYITSDVNSNAVEGGFYLGNSGHGLRRPGGASNDVYLYTTSGNVFIGAAGSTSQQITVLTGGNVGISTTTPSYKLHVDANTSALFRVSNGAPLTYFQSSYYGYASSYEVAQIGDWYGKSSSGVAVAIGIDPKLITGGSFFGNEIALPDFTEFITANAPSGSATDWNQNVLVISGSNVGIGTATPLSKLHVNGDIRASLANVSQANLVAYNTSTGLFTYLSTSSFATTNIYNADGTLTGNRTVSLDANSLTFVAEEADFTIQSGPEVSVNITSLPQENRPHLLFYDSGTGQLLFDETSSISSSPGGSDGQVQYNNGGVFGGASELFYNDSTGNVGIGTTGPLVGLDVRGTTIITNPSGNNYNENLRLPQNPTGYAVITLGGAIAANGSDANQWSLLRNPSNEFEIRRQDTVLALINPSGNLGIGTNPQTPFKLDVNGAGRFNYYIRLHDGNNPWDIGALFNYTNSDLFFSMNGSEKMRMNSNGQLCIGYSGANATGANSLIAAGNVGIGITTPSAKLDVNGDTFIRGTEYILQSVNNTTGYLYFDHSGTQVWKQGIFSDNTSTFSIGNGGGFTRLFNITNSGNVGIGTTSPGSKLVVIGGIGATGGEGYNTFGLGAWIGGDGTNGLLYMRSGASWVPGYIDASAIYLNAQSGGNVGISTTIPTSKLDVRGNIAIGATGYNGGVFAWSGASTDQNWGFVIQRTAATDDYNVRSQFYPEAGSARKLGFYDARNTAWLGYFDGSVNSNPNFIFNAGNVGIGVNTPQKKLEVITAASDFASVGVTGLGVGQWTGIHFGYRENNQNYRKSAIVFERTDLTANDAQGKVHILNGPQGGAGSATLADARLTIGESGNVGIGNTNPAAKLQVAGDIRASLSNVNQVNFVAYNSSTGLFTYAATSSITVGTATNADNVFINEDSTDADQPVLFAENTADYYPVRGNKAQLNFNPSTGTLTAVAYVESSALRFKENIVHLTGSLHQVEQLQGVSYNRIGQTRKEIGFIADEVVKILPELVKYQDGEVYGLSYNRVTAVLVEAVKELSDKVNQQEIFIQDLADRLKKLEDKG